jgi:hypothetical protein
VFRLALSLGMTVRELLAKLGSDELSEWMAFYQLEPFGDFRADYRSALMTSTFANAHRHKDSPPFSPEDFMPFIERQPSMSDAKSNAMRLKAMFSHLVKKNG